MKKVFLFISALLLSSAINAVSPGTNTLRSAYNSAEAGSTLVLESGTYEETERFAFTKSMTIMAAEGAEVIIKTYKDNQITKGAEIKFVGIKFDGSAYPGSNNYEYFIRSYDATAGNELHFENCELYDFPSTTYLINAASNSRTLDSVIINNCYFHNNGRDVIFVDGTEASKGIVITNSTFANSSAYHSLIEVRNGSSEPADNIKLTVDHCTFYNNTFGDGDYTNIRAYKLNKAYISNCIFAHPEASSKYAIYNYGGTISNCLNYNFTGYRDWSPSPTISNCLTDDPRFADAVNSDFHLSEGSPALFAADDNSHLGDPRWYPAIPSTDFVTPYIFTGAAAALSGKICKTDDENKYLYGDGGHNENYGSAQWQIHATKDCYLQVKLKIGSENNGAGHQFKVEVFDSENNPVGDPLVEAAKNYKNEDVIFPDLLRLNADQDYRIKLSNLTTWSSAYIRGIEFSYAGGDVIEVPANTLEVADALFSENGTRADGVIAFGNALTGWAKWNITITKEAFYTIAATIKNQYGHNVAISLYEEDGETLVGEVSEGGSVYTKNSEGLLLNLGGLYLKAGNYVVKYTNATEGSDAKIKDVTFTYAGGAVQAMPGATTLSESWYSNNGTRDENKITFPGSTIQDGWVKWNVTFANSSNYAAKVKINTTSGHNYTVKLYRSETDTDPITYANGADYDHTGTAIELTMEPQLIEAGDYILVVTNGLQNSNAELISVEFVYNGGGTVDIPATLQPMDATFSTNASIKEGKIDFNPSDNSSEEWAKWNVSTTGGLFTFTINAYNSTQDVGQTYAIKVYDPADEEHPLINETSSWDENEGAYQFSTAAAELPQGDYVVKVQNSTNWSVGRVVNVVANYVGGALVTIPGSVNIADALISSGATRDENGLRFNGIVSEFAQWNMYAPAGVYNFTLNVTGTNYSKYKLDVIDADENIVFTYTQGKSGSGSVTINNVFIPETGNYTLQLANVNVEADGNITSMSAAAVDGILVLNEMSTDMESIIANHGVSKKLALKRAFRTGVYNSICLPVNVSHTSELTSIFGEGYELLELNDATLDGSVLTLNFITPTNGIHHGTPYLIKPTKDVVNPIFSSHTISKDESYNSVTKGCVNLEGIFYKKDLGVHPENLYLDANGNLAFTNSAVTIKGFRAYFHVNMANPQQVIKHARIVTSGQVATEIDLVNAESNGINKLIENGQVVIIKNGVRYNAQGQRLQ